MKNKKVICIVLSIIIILSIIIFSIFLISKNVFSNNFFTSKKSYYSQNQRINNIQENTSKEKVIEEVEKQVSEQEEKKENIANNYSINKITNATSSVRDDDGTNTVDTTKWDTSKVKKVTDKNGENVPVPIGYVESSVDGENTVKDGFVIYEGENEVTSKNVEDARNNRNQWVWVPATKPSRIYTEENGKKRGNLYTYTYYSDEKFVDKTNETKASEPKLLQNIENEQNLFKFGYGLKRQDLDQDLVNEFNLTMESISKYGGFYIGRYETGDLSKEIPVVKKMNDDISNQNWYTMYNKMKYLAPNDNVGTNILWGCLWDETIQWFFKKDFNTRLDWLVIDSSYMGNFVESTFQYTDKNGQNKTKPAYSRIKLPTGCSNHTKMNNIYDLAGNVFEWTLEGFSETERTLHGGSYEFVGYQVTATTRKSANPTTSANDRGFRAYLYIK